MKFLILPILLSIFFIHEGCLDSGQNPVPLQQNSNTLLWKVSGKELKNPSYLFGTFHLLCKDDIHFSKNLEQALKNSNEVYMELKLDDPSTVFGGLLYMKMKDGKKLSDLYSPQDYARINRYFADSLKIPLSFLQDTKPYLLVALLYPRMMNCGSPTGVEEELMKLAKQDQKEIKGLETVQFQASLFDSIPYRFQAKQLLDNIDSLAEYKKEFSKMVSFYKAQEIDSLQNMVSRDDFGSKHFDDLLLKDRNKRWVSILDTIMPKESVFVAVGTGHLTGPNGLISLLKHSGYHVDPVDNH